MGLVGFFVLPATHCSPFFGLSAIPYSNFSKDRKATEAGGMGGCGKVLDSLQKKSCGPYCGPQCTIHHTSELVPLPFSNAEGSIGSTDSKAGL